LVALDDLVALPQLSLLFFFEFLDEFMVGAFADFDDFGAFVDFGVLVGLGDMDGKQEGATLNDGK
jgi:hypothetical protein